MSIQNSISLPRAAKLAVKGYRKSGAWLRHSAWPDLAGSCGSCPLALVAPYVWRSRRGRPASTTHSYCAHQYPCSQPTTAKVQKKRPTRAPRLPRRHWTDASDRAAAQYTISCRCDGTRHGRLRGGFRRGLEAGAHVLGRGIVNHGTQFIQVQLVDCSPP